MIHNVQHVQNYVTQKFIPTRLISLNHSVLLAYGLANYIIAKELTRFQSYYRMVIVRELSNVIIWELPGKIIT